MDTKMPTAVVVATVINTSMSEAAFRQHMVEQLQNNDRGLLDKLADADADANVYTAVLNVEEFLAYLIHRFPQTVDAALSTGEIESGATAERLDAGVATDKMTVNKMSEGKMSEGEFMNHVLMQLQSGEREPILQMPDEEWPEAEDEPIGEHFSRYPFLY